MGCKDGIDPANCPQKGLHSLGFGANIGTTFSVNKGRRLLVGVVLWDELWFDKWIVASPPPVIVQLVQRRDRTTVDDKE
jgi:hypothetical protein